ncbi:MAG TPA: FxsB family cyclophane-forming radical SAM/SPASM peptide maturase [Streptosporangiaceae bacterium]
MAFSQFVVKVHSRCDLACDICYVYQHADQSWRGRPPVMAPETARKTAERIAEHATAHHVPEIQIILHGGEPLLAGVTGLGKIIQEFKAVLETVCRVKLLVQTNGTLLNRRFCDLMRSHGVMVGVSLDGDKEANDRHRRHADGRSSYHQVVRGIDLLRTEYRDLYLGLLCTIDVANDPRVVYESLLSHDPPSLNFLLPHATWDTPPPGRSIDAYADWLITIFELWYASGRPVPIVFFDSLLGTLHGQESTAEAHGLDPDDVIVIETDGQIEQADSLKTAFDGAPATGLDVFAHSFDMAAAHPDVLRRQKGLANLAPECRSCQVVAACGGGMVAHRYGRGRGFANPSVYCAALKKLIDHMSDVAARPLPLSGFDVLASGGATGAALAELATGQRVIRRVLLARLVRGRRDLRMLLEAVDRASRASLTSVSDHPAFRAWAVDALTNDAGADRLASYAAAIAMRAGLTAELVLSGSGGRIHLPTIGSYEIDTRTVTVRVHDGRCELPDGALRPTPVLRAEGHAVRLDDTDPDRGRPGWAVAPELGDEEIRAWQEMFSQAWEIIRVDHAPYAAGVRALVTTLIPLVAPPGGAQVAAHPHMFGALGMVLPREPRAFAELLIRGHQYSKIAAIQDLVDLHDGSDPEFGRRLDTVYAELALPGRRPDWSDLAAATCLTPAGRRFVARMRASAEGATRRTR